MVAILIEEKMGYKVEMKGPGPSTPDAFFALAGCLTPTNISDRRCGGSKTYAPWAQSFMGAVALKDLYPMSRGPYLC